jgi:hypothetical protein
MAKCEFSIGANSKVKCYQHYIFDWGDTLMVDLPGQNGPMCDWPEIEVVAGATECLSALSKFAKCHVATNALNSNESQIRAAACISKSANAFAGGTKTL